MKPKSTDTQYGPYSKDIINTYNPEIDWESVRLYFDYVLERFRIQKRREAGFPYPWTDNEIMRVNSFTNNRREDDRTTKWLIEHISNNPNLSAKDRVWRSIIFRLYNKIETAELIGLDKEDFWDKIEEAADRLDAHVGDVYTRAYKTVSIKYRYKENYPDRNWKSLRLLGTRDLRDSYQGTVPSNLWSTPDKALEWIKTLPGVGDFVGMQILIDLMYIDIIPYSNNYFVVAGPGAKAGLDRLFIDKDKMTYEQCLFYIKYNFNELYKRATGFTDDIEAIIQEFHNDPYAYCVTDIQNTFCEYSKYRYLMEGRHKAPRKYIPQEV